MVYLHGVAKLIEDFQRKESDLTFVIVLEIEVSIAANATAREAFYFGYFNHRMRIRLPSMMTNKIVSRGNEQVTNLHRIHATIEAPQTHERKRHRITEDYPPKTRRRA